jgi:large subunit ribosomal protein L29
LSKLSEERRRVAGLDVVSAEQELKEKRRALFDLRIQKERGEVKDTRQFAKTKADIARLMYHISELHQAAQFEDEETPEQEEPGQESGHARGAATPVGAGEAGD